MEKGDSLWDLADLSGPVWTNAMYWEGKSLIITKSSAEYHKKILDWNISFLKRPTFSHLSEASRSEAEASNALS